MNTTPAQSESKQRVEHILSTLYRYKAFWIAPAALAMVLSAVYVSVIRQKSWSAKQSLIVRDDLLGQSFKPGRFDSVESMKSAQETILEIARKPQVIFNALSQLGPGPVGPFGRGDKDWPSEETIESVQGDITFHAPNGAEFGKTEVIVLSTKSSTRERSQKFIELLLDEIIIKADEVRTMRLRSMESELTLACDSAIEDMQESEAKVRAMDESLGSDLGMMALLNDSLSSVNVIKSDMSQIRLDRRKVKTELESLETALAQLVAAKDNPKQIFTTSAALVNLLPAVDDLKKALITQKVELAAMSQFQPIHPSYRKAQDAIDVMQQQVHMELDALIGRLKNDVSLTENQLLRLDAEMNGLNERLVKLSSKRATMRTLESELEKRTDSANSAKSDLSEIQGLLQSRNAGLITRVGDPQVSTRPDGLGKKATVLAAGLGGLMMGLGWIMLIAPPMALPHPQSVEQASKQAKHPEYVMPGTGSGESIQRHSLKTDNSTGEKSSELGGSELNEFDRAGSVSATLAPEVPSSGPTEHVENQPTVENQRNVAHEATTADELFGASAIASPAHPAALPSSTSPSMFQAQPATNTRSNRSFTVRPGDLAEQLPPNLNP